MTVHRLAVDVMTVQLPGQYQDTHVSYRAQIHKLTQLVLKVALVNQEHIAPLYRVRITIVRYMHV